MSKKPFLVGGQFPVPVVQGGATAGAITVQFKDYGIKLTFTPNITANNNIKMHLTQEVSTLDLANRVVIERIHHPRALPRGPLNRRGTGRRAKLRGGRPDQQPGTEHDFEGSRIQQHSHPRSLFKSKDDEVQRQELIMVVTPRSPCL